MHSRGRGTEAYLGVQCYESSRMLYYLGQGLQTYVWIKPV